MHGRFSISCESSTTVVGSVGCSGEEGSSGSVAEEIVIFSAVGCSVVYSVSGCSDTMSVVCSVATSLYVTSCSMVGCSGGFTLDNVDLAVAWLGGEEISLNMLACRL